MKEFFKRYKNIILIAASSLALVAAVAAIVIITSKTPTEYYADTAASSQQDDSTVTSVEGDVSSEPIQSDTSEPEEPEPDPVIPLTITSPSATDITVADSVFAIVGSCDPEKPLILNGQEVEKLESGEFSFDVNLVPGNNTFNFEYDGESVSYIIRYNFTIIKAYAPYEKQKYEAGSSFVAVAYARVDSSRVTATFNGKTITLEPQPYKEGEEFTNFTGTFNLPTGNENDIDLGGVKFTGECKGLSRSYTSPSVICLRDKALDGTQIVEIVASQAETFNGNTTDDASRPTNSYLPKGTVDYKVGGIVYEPDSGNSYYNLRCGKRVYITKKNSPEPNRVTVSKMYAGELPEHNTVAFAQGEVDNKHTIFTFDTAWKAPFAVELLPQIYENPSKQEYEITSTTYSYVDIKFFYTQTIEGDFTLYDHPLFSNIEVIPADDGCVLRLHLNEVGAFYGWNAEYNKSGQLVFKFLNPPTITQKDDLSGITIVVDAGHGGKDIGAPGLRPDTMYEAERNLSLAFKLKADLEFYGATVIMTRTSDVTLSADDRCEFLRAIAPDLCISIHHDSNTSSRPNGGGIFCFNAFSDKVTQYVFEHTQKGGFYTKTEKEWHYFFLARVSVCPVVLTENGFISNPQDFAGISDDRMNVLKARAITDGVIAYFNDFYKSVANDGDLNYNGSVNTEEPVEENEIIGDNNG